MDRMEGKVVVDGGGSAEELIVELCATKKKLGLLDEEAGSIPCETMP
jgi:hypothetical protein